MGSNGSSSNRSTISTSIRESKELSLPFFRHEALFIDFPLLQNRLFGFWNPRFYLKEKYFNNKKRLQKYLLTPRRVETLEFRGPADRRELMFHSIKNGLLDRFPTDPGPSKLLDSSVVFRFSGFFGVRSMGPGGNFLDSSWLFLPKRYSR